MREASGSELLAVALDVSAVPSEPAGAGRYIVELVRALDKVEGLSLCLISRRDDLDRWSGYAPGAGLAGLVPGPRPARLAYERLYLGRRLGRPRRSAPAVYHGPHYTMPGGISWAGRVVTVHDLTFLEHPEWHEAAKVPYFRAAIRRAAREADVVICVSATTAARLVELVEVRAEVVVAEHGVDHDRFSPGAPDPSALPAGTGEWLGPEPTAGRLVVHVGTLEPRKGLVDLVRAFDSLAGGRPELRLVLAGLPGWKVAEVTAAVASARAREQIRLLGWVPDAAVVSLMRAAGVVCYPSYEEGFGLPALEALATGAPLVTSRATAMAEFAGEAAWLATPGDVASLAAALAAALDSPAKERLGRQAAGLARSAAFTWETTATKHLAAYATAAAAARARLRR